MSVRLIQAAEYEYVGVLQGEFVFNERVHNTGVKLIVSEAKYVDSETNCVFFFTHRNGEPVVEYSYATAKRKHLISTDYLESLGFVPEMPVAN